MTATATPPAAATNGTGTQDRMKFLFGSSTPVTGGALPPITARLSSSEAMQVRRKSYEPPPWADMEPVMYRPHKSKVEYPAWLITSYNKTFHLYAAINKGVESVKDVAYYDPAFPTQSDPYAPFNNNGTFRKTRFPALVYKLLEGGVEVSFEKLAGAVARMEDKVSRVVSPSDAKKLEERLAAMEKRLAELFTANAETTKLVKDAGSADFIKRFDNLEAKVFELIAHLEAAAVEDDDEEEGQSPSPKTTAKK